MFYSGFTFAAGIFAFIVLAFIIYRFFPYLLSFIVIIGGLGLAFFLSYSLTHNIFWSVVMILAFAFVNLTANWFRENGNKDIKVIIKDILQKKLI